MSSYAAIAKSHQYHGKPLVSANGGSSVPRSNNSRRPKNFQGKSRPKENKNVNRKKSPVEQSPILSWQEQQRNTYGYQTYHGITMVSNDTALYITYVHSKEEVATIVEHLISQAIDVIKNSKNSEKDIDLRYDVRINWVDCSQKGQDEHKKFAIVDIDNAYIVRTILNKNLDGSDRYQIIEEKSSSEEEMDYQSMPIWGDVACDDKVDESPSLSSSGASWADLSGDVTISRVESPPLISFDDLNAKIESYGLFPPREGEEFRSIKIFGLPFDDKEKILEIYARYARYAPSGTRWWPVVKTYPDRNNGRLFIANITYQDYYDAAFAVSMCRKMTIDHLGVEYPIATNFFRYQTK